VGQTTFFCAAGKQILLAVVFCLLIASLATAQSTFNWTNNGGDNTWTNQDNWNPVSLPTASDTAVINGGTATTLALRPSNSPGSVSIGTLIIGNFSTYTHIVPGASAATVNFGTNAGLRFGDVNSGAQTFTFGSSAVTSVVNGTLTIAAVDAFSSFPEVIQYDANIIGTGRVITEDGIVELNGSNTFSGGFRITAGT
jgi:hypothetical protein